MSPQHSKFWLAMVPMVVAGWTLNAQTVERVTFYRDAALESWKGEATQGRVEVARSQSDLDASRVRIFPASGTGQLGLDEAVGHAKYSTEAQAKRKGWDQELASLTLELALRRAQLDLVEEDLDMLRANRNVGGTAESILVEDLEELSDWMHEAFRDALYRRVELREELATMEQNVAALRAERSEWTDSQPYALSVRWPEGQEGEVWADVLESEGAHWSLVHQVQVLGKGQALWEKRGRYRLGLPKAVKTQVVFADENWPGFAGESRWAGGADAEGQTYERRPAKGLQPERPANQRWSNWGSQYVMENPMMLGDDTEGEVVLTSAEVPIRRRYVSIPKRSNAVQMQLLVPQSARPMVTASEVRLLDESGVPALRSMVLSGDTMIVEAGVASLWSIQRSKEEALCRRVPLGNRIQHRRAFIIEVTNRSDRAGKLTLIEPLPSSRALEIEVASEDLDGGRLDAATESLIWSLALKAGETRTVKFAYDLTHDKGVELSDKD